MKRPGGSPTPTNAGTSTSPQQSTTDSSGSQIPTDPAQIITNQLRDLRASLDSGGISFSDFLSKGQDLAESALAQYNQRSTQGSGEAQKVNYIADMLRGSGGLYGFKLENDGRTITPNLGQKYYKQGFDELLPSDISPEEKQQFFDSLPKNIDPYSDRGQLELEALREKSQLKGTAQQMLTLDMPQITEDLQSRGLLNSSALGEALAREKKNLVMAGSNPIVALQQAGIQRQFGLSDFDTQARLAREIGAAQVPQMGGSNGLMSAFGGGMSGAMVGGQVGGPPGALWGALLGAGGGYGASRGGGK